MMDFQVLRSTPSPATVLGLQSPRKSKSVEDEVLDEKDSFEAENQEGLKKEATGDTLQFSKKKILEEPSIELTEKQKQVKTLLHNQKIHDAKVSASWWSSIPYLGIPIALLSNSFSSPEDNAKKRYDVLTEGQSLETAVEEEKEIKQAKIKAGLVTIVSQTTGIFLGVIGGLFVKQVTAEELAQQIDSSSIPDMFKELVDILEWMSKSKGTVSQQTPFGKTLSSLAWITGTSCILAPLGYMLFEKPSDEKFNKTL